ncbi:hypothetical protein [Roseivirga sp. E12]|uniref:hypothetical protein n=1 Tax=Roseivirga sp. E12 TaxID=2819237 RepID=UPI001ABC02FC|nr:hypothetical protein [Roseivirga sp. E12]MBO3700407.1 hypothetical protein [Roseivirga sp. E12]
MKKKIIGLLSLMFIGVAMFSTVKVEAQTPPSGTCCPTQSGAICIVGTNMLENYYYLSSGDCPNPGGGGGGTIGEN